MADKNDLRRVAAAHRRTLVCAGHGTVLVSVARDLALTPGAVVAGYAAFRDEADPRDVMRVLAAHGHPLALPVVQGKAQPLLFRRWQEGDVLVTHSYGMAEPHPQAEAVTPSVLLVPLLAFDRTGYRLGYGGGFYDRTLEALRMVGPITAIGIAYAGQMVDAVPHDDLDQRLDAVLTEAGLMRF